jgi:phospholipid transport system transporter-binding protein
VPAELKAAGEGRLTLSGALDFDSVPAIYRQMASHMKPGAKLSVNLKRVGHFNSAGLSLLLQWLEDARKNNVDLTFLNLPPAHTELASLYNISGLFGGK